MQEDPARAIALLEGALPIPREQQNPQDVGWALNHLGHAAQMQGNYAEARRLMAAAREQLGDAAYTAAREAGEAAPTSAAIARALQSEAEA